MNIVEVHALTKSYGGRPPALSDVDMVIGEGVTGLLGPNGAGKSTLIQCVLGLLPDYSGSIKVLGLDARTHSREIRRRVGFMPESDTYLAEMTGIKSVRYLGQLTGMPRDQALRRAHEVLFHVGLGEAIYRPVREYSTGMRQRFKLAQALVHDPEVIFLDEPLAGLDPKAREELLDTIHALATHHGKHVIWSSHILPDVQKVADSIAVLKDGRSRGTYRLDELAPREGLYAVEVEVPGKEAVADLERALVEARVALMEPTVFEQDDDAVAMTANLVVDVGPHTGPAPIFQVVKARGGRVRQVRPLTEELEDVFMRILGDEIVEVQAEELV